MIWHLSPCPKFGVFVVVVAFSFSENDKMCFSSSPLLFRYQVASSTSSLHFQCTTIHFFCSFFFINVHRILRLFVFIYAFFLYSFVILSKFLLHTRFYNSHKIRIFIPSERFRAQIVTLWTWQMHITLMFRLHQIRAFHFFIFASFAVHFSLSFVS